LDKWIKTKTGALGFGKNALAEMQELPEMAALLKHKKTSKLISTYGNSLTALVNPITLRVHSSFSLGETKTGRLSSRDPNLQNLPRKSTMRDIFVAEKGKKLIVADFNQIELRVAGEVSGDPVIRGAYAKGDDLHSIFAARIYGVPIRRVTKEQRQIAKSANFGTIYGMGPNKFITYVLAATDGKVKMKFEEADHIIKALWSLYSVYAAWCKKIRQQAEIIGFVRTPLGKMRKLHPKEVYTKAPNTVVQGGAFEVMADAMIRLKAVLDTCHIPAKIINSVHDEIIVECDPDDTDKVSKLVKKTMGQGMQHVFPKANLNKIAKIVVCDSWGEGKA